jgi:hypothetical protein
MVFRSQSVTGSVVVSLVCSTGLAQDMAGRTANTSFRIMFIRDIGSPGEKALIHTRATKSRVSSIQNEILANPALTKMLIEQGVGIRDIVGRSPTMSGSTIYYVR